MTFYLKQGDVGECKQTQVYNIHSGIKPNLTMEGVQFVNQFLGISKAKGTH